MITYPAFIKELGPLVEEARVFRNAQKMHKDERFRKWRNKLEGLLSQIVQADYLLPCPVRTKSRHFGGYGYTPDERQKELLFQSYQTEIDDTINELELVIDSYKKFGEPPKSPARGLTTLANGTSEQRESGLIARFRQHWLISLIALCSVVAAATWGLAVQILVNPRDFEIARLEKALQQAKEASSASSAPVLLEAGIPEGTSATTSDGSCSIFVKKIVDGQVTLVVTLKAEEPRVFEKIEVGRRITVASGKVAYFIDVRRLRGNIADVSVSRQN